MKSAEHRALRTEDRGLRHPRLRHRPGGSLRHRPKLGLTVNFTPTKRLVRDGRQLEHPIVLAIGDVEVASAVDGHPDGVIEASKRQFDWGGAAVGQLEHTPSASLSTQLFWLAVM